jgi:hypothetical protein
MMKVRGKVHHITPIQTFNSGFQKQELVLDITDKPEYPNYAVFEVLQKLFGYVEAVQIGTIVEVEYNIRGRQHENKFYSNLQAWRITAEGPPPQVQQQQQYQQPGPPPNAYDPNKSY